MAFSEKLNLSLKIIWKSNEKLLKQKFRYLNTRTLFILQMYLSCGYIAYRMFEINFSMYYKSSKRITEAELILLHKNAFVTGC